MEEAGLWPGKTFLDYFEAVAAARPEARALTTFVSRTAPATISPGPSSTRSPDGSPPASSASG
jgi:hypothetical protein